MANARAARGSRSWSSLISLGLVCAGAACAPRVQVAAPDEPIVINLNVQVQQEVRVRLEDDVRALLEAEDKPVRTRGDTPGEQQRLVDAKAAGLLGERLDGLVGVVSPQIAPEILELQRAENERRKLAYAQLADQSRSAVSAVQLLAGQERIARAGSGEFVMDAERVWRRK